VNTVVDLLSDPTGWTASVGASIEPVNQHAQLIAGNNSASLVFKFTEEDAYVEKTFSTPIDITGFPQIVLHAWSRFFKTHSYEKPADFYYDIDFGDSVKRLLQVRPTWEYSEIDVGALVSITKIRITSRQNISDYLVVSNCLACVDELPIDIFRGVKEQIEWEINQNLGDGILVGTCDTDQGQKTLSLKTTDETKELNFVEKHAVVKLKKNSTSERHQLWDFLDRKWSMTSLYDGKEILNSMNGASVYLTLPVEFGQNEKEILSPGIVIWGLIGEPFERTSKLDEQVDSFQEDQASIRRDGQPIRWTIQIDVNSRSAELAAIMSHHVRRVLSKNKIWVNGKKVTINFLGAPTDEAPSQAYGQEIKLTYQASVEIIEDVYNRSVAFLANQAALTVNISKNLINHLGD